MNMSVFAGMISVPRMLGSFEQPLLLAVDELGEDAYGGALADHLQMELGRKITSGQVSRTLSNLHQLGIVESRTVLPRNRTRGQRSRLVFSLTPKGRKLLRELKAADTNKSLSVSATAGKAAAMV